MKKISTAQLQRNQRFQLDAMDDLCNVYRVGFATGTTYPNTVKVRTAVYSNLPCGIHFTNGQVKQGGQVMFVDYDCILRIVDNVTILTDYEVDLVEKGEFLVSGTFKPNSAPTVNSSVQNLQLKRQEA
jgi:hypothetical protein